MSFHLSAKCETRVELMLEENEGKKTFPMSRLWIAAEEGKEIITIVQIRIVQLFNFDRKTSGGLAMS